MIKIHFEKESKMAVNVSLGELSDILECAICLDPVRNPKTLACHHSYCKNCLDNLVDFDENGAAVIQCPRACKRLTRIPREQTTNDLGVEFMLKRIVDVMVTKEKKKERSLNNVFSKCCEQCNHSFQGYCAVCDTLVCATSSIKHTSCKHILPISFNIKDKKMSPQCEKHKSDAYWVCCDNEFICKYCIKRDHKGHPYDSIEEHVETLKGLISKEIEQMNTFVKGINEKLQKNEKSISAAKEDLDNVLRWRKIRCISDYMDYLNSEEEVISKEFDKAATVNKKSLFIDFIDPTKTFKEFLSKENFRVVLQRERIKEQIEKLQKQKKKTVKDMNISISANAFEYNDVHPLGVLNVTQGKPVPVNESNLEFVANFVVDESLLLKEKIQLNIRDLCKNVNTEISRPIEKLPEKTEPDIMAADVVKDPLERPVQILVEGLHSRKRMIRNDSEINMFFDELCYAIDDDLYDSNVGSDEMVLDTDGWLKKLDEKGVCFIENLIRHGNNNLLNILLQERPNILTMKCNEPPLHDRPIHMAARYNNLFFLKTILKHSGHMITLQNGCGWNSIHSSATSDRSFDCFSWLVGQYPEFLCHKDNSGSTALHIAARNNNIKCLRFCLDKDIDIWGTDNDGNTPYDLALFYNFTEIMNLLQDKMI